MHPSDLGIKIPLEVVHLYGDGAVSLGDGQPVVTEYPCPPMSAFELHGYMGFGRRKSVVPDHVKELKKKHPDLFEEHARQVFEHRYGKVQRMSEKDLDGVLDGMVDELERRLKVRGVL
jgi:hypothetical protein